MSLALGMVVVSALLVGALIGCVGIGGVLLPPALVYLGGLDPHLAAATSVWAFLFTGTAGTISYAGRRSIDWRMAAWLGAGVVPAAVLGARANAALPDGALLILLAVLMVGAGADALLRPAVRGRTCSFGAPALAAIGVVVGFGSALTGTGGPVLLVPILLFLRVPVLIAVGVSQAIQLPVATFSTVGYVLFGRVDFVLGSALGLVAVAGVAFGSRVAHATPVAVLRRIVAVSLIGAGLLIGVRAASGPPTAAGGSPQTSAAPACAVPATAAVGAHREATVQTRKA